MRANFDKQLEELNRELTEMGARCEDAIAASVKALLGGGAELAAKAEEYEREIDRMERRIEDLCMRLLLQQQPVAHDLRTISSALKMITDMERIGDQAADIAELVGVAEISKYEGAGHINEMATAAIRMVTDSVRAFVARDLTLARRVIEADDNVDNLFTQVKGDLVKYIVEAPARGEAAIDILMIAKYLERIADHATNIAEWVEYSITGIHCEEAE